MIDKKRIDEAKNNFDNYLKEGLIKKEKNEIAFITYIKNSELSLKLAEKIIKENEKAVKDYKSGQNNALNFLIGQLMKLSNKRADFKTARQVLEKLLK